MDNRVCPVCGKKIKYLDGKAKWQNKTFCSRNCYYYSRSPLLQMAAAEKLKPDQLILKMLNSSDDVTMAAGLIGMSQPDLARWIKKLGIHQKWVM